MKKLIFTISMAFAALATNAQNCTWHEDFDAPSLDDSVTTYSFNPGNSGFQIDSRLFVSAGNSDSAYLHQGDTIMLTTGMMDFTNMNFVILSFDQICKIHFFDRAELYYSYDSTTWQQLTCSEYTGLAPFCLQLNSFSGASYGDWFPGVPDTVPNNSWWHHETFDLSGPGANIPTFWIRWQMYDANNDDTTFLTLQNGWHLDNICVQAAPCELNLPLAGQKQPIYNNIAYSLGPYDLNIWAVDQSGIQNAYLIYTINSGPPDTVNMSNIMDSTWTGQIPAVNAGDTICYYFTVIDGSGCFNTITLPQHCFVASAGISFPYCLENFDAAILWTDTNAVIGGTGSNWELGTPAFGATTGAHSPPNAWDIDLTSGYQNNSNCYLYSPVFAFPSPVNARLTFWQNRQTDIQADGVVLEYSTDLGLSWNVLGSIGCPTCINWYTNNIFTNNKPGWDGSSNGWVKSDYIFPAGFPPAAQFMLRFGFVSDGFGTQAGFSLDDLCFTLAENDDPGLSTIVSPNGNAPAGTCVPITVTIHNYGSNNLDSTNVYYTYDGDTLGPFLWSGPTLAPGQEAQFTMPCDSLLPGYHDICAWVTLGLDVNHFNDTVCATVFGIPTIVVDSLTPYCDDFEGASSIWFSQLEPGGNPGTIWELGAPAFGATNSAHSGVKAWDINLTSAYTNNANVGLYTPFFDVQNVSNPYISFWTNYNTETNWDGVRLEYATNGQNNWTLVNPPSGTTNWYTMPSINCSQQPAWANNPGFGWLQSKAEDLSSLVNLATANFVQFRFIFCSDASVIYDGFTIDDFCFAMPAPYDAGIPSIIQPGFSAAAGSCSPVEVTIKNFGYNTLTNVNVYYSKDDLPYGNPVTYGPYLWTGSLLAGASTTWILPVCDTVPPGQYNFCSWTELINPQVDGNLYNDTSCTQSVGVPIIPLSYTNSYCDDFENGNIGWAVETLAPGTQWQLGTPAFGLTTGAHSPDTCWDVNLTTAPQANANTYLYSPIFDFTAAVDAEIDFYINFNTGINQDGVKLEYKKNNGAWVQWFATGFTTNWYNSTACNQAGWSGNSATVLQGTVNGWGHVTNTELGSLFNGPNLVQFRFKYCSGTFVGFPNDGFSLDDFCLIVPVPLTISPVTINNNSNPPFIFPGQTITFDSDIKNMGTTPIDTAVANLYIDGFLPVNLIASDTIAYPTPLNTGQFQNHVFSNTWVTTPGVHSICVVTSYPNKGVDLNPTDDTICSTISVIDTVSVTGGAYCPDFDTAPQWVTMNSYNFGPNTSWVLGTPNKGFMTTANTGTKAWVLGGLTTNYPNRDSSALFTPAFNIQTNRTYRLSFFHEYQMEFYQDGGNVEYSTDFGATWNVMGTGGFVNWYDSWFVTALGGTPPQPGWSLSKPVWANPSYWTICFQPQNGQNAYPVMFRFRFASDNTVNDLGWAIDDFCFEDLGPCPLGIDEISSASGLALGQNYPNPTNGMTSIDYLIPSKGKVVLEVINLLGQVMDTPVDKTETSGIHTISFNSSKLSPGIYYYALTFNKERLVKKMVIVK